MTNVPLIALHPAAQTTALAWSDDETYLLLADSSGALILLEHNTVLRRLQPWSPKS